MAKRSGQSGSIERKGNFWHVRYLVDTPNGRKRKSDPVGRIDQITKTQARRLGDAYIHELGINTPQSLERAFAAPTFDAALQRWREACLVVFKPSGKQSATYVVRKHVEPKFKGVLLENVDKQATQLWINELSASGLAPKTVSNVVKMLKSILNWSEVGTRDWKLRMPEIPEEEQRWFTAVEVEKIVEEADGQYRVLFRLAYASGMRAGELFGLHVTDFDFAKGTVRVQRSTFRNLENSPKSQKSRRMIYLDALTLKMVHEHLAGRMSGRIFMTRLGTPLKMDVNRDVLKPICRQLGIPVGTMHAFRHGRVSKMQDAGVNEKVIQTEIGHSTLRMTRRYTHFSPEQRRATAEKLAAND
jgi:integrase